MKQLQLIQNELRNLIVTQTTCRTARPDSTFNENMDEVATLRSLNMLVLNKSTISCYRANIMRLLCNRWTGQHTKSLGQFLWKNWPLNNLDFSEDELVNDVHTVQAPSIAFQFFSVTETRPRTFFIAKSRYNTPFLKADLGH